MLPWHRQCCWCANRNSSGVEIRIRGETPAKYRQLLRLAKFHRLVCEVENGGEGPHFKLDGPLSLFSATQKYGLQLALFLPAVLNAKDFELHAELRWGPLRAAKTFDLTSQQGLVPHDADHGVYVPPELAMFVELFRKRVDDWEILEETDLLPLGPGFWVPDYRLLHKATGVVVYLEVLGYWRRAQAEKHLENLRRYACQPFVLAVSADFHVDDEDFGRVCPAGVHQFRQMPLPDEVVRWRKVMRVERWRSTVMRIGVVSRVRQAVRALGFALAIVALSRQNTTMSSDNLGSQSRKIVQQRTVLPCGSCR